MKTKRPSVSSRGVSLNLNNPSGLATKNSRSCGKRKKRNGQNVRHTFKRKRSTKVTRDQINTRSRARPPAPPGANVHVYRPCVTSTRTPLDPSALVSGSATRPALPRRCWEMLGRCFGDAWDMRGRSALVRDMRGRSDLVRISSAPLEDLVEHLGARHLHHRAIGCLHAGGLVPG